MPRAWLSNTRSCEFRATPEPSRDHNLRAMRKVRRHYSVGKLMEGKQTVYRVTLYARAATWPSDELP